jgi:carbon starvation protein
MFFATMAFLTATTAFGSFQGYKDAGSALQVFSKGLAAFMNQWGLPTSIGVPYGGVFLVLMALTIMYLVVRFMRVASAEFLGDTLPIMRNTAVGTIVALILSAILIWTGFWSYIWILFGAANQLMASLALLLVSLWLISQGKSYLWTFIPFIFMFVTTIAALLRTAWKLLESNLAGGLAVDKVIGNWIAFVLAVFLAVAALILAFDAVRAIQRYQAEAAAPT